MNRSIQNTYRRLLAQTHFSTHRYLFQYFNTNNRLTGLIGARGTGKTTMMLQYIKEKLNVQKCIYASADNIYFLKNKITEFVEESYEIEGIRYFFIDEIHKYNNWNQELKNIYDSFPEIHIVFSGSSIIDLLQGTYDLSRRGKIYRLEGLSFREYIVFKYNIDLPVLTFKEIIKQEPEKIDQICQTPQIRGYFKEYIEKGYYPFLFENEEDYLEKLNNVINKTIYEDVSNYYSLKTQNLLYFKKIIAFLTTIPPGEININTISRIIGLDNKTISHYLTILNNTGLTCIVGSEKSGSTMLKSTEKIFLNNTNLYYAISKEIGHSIEYGTLREIFFFFFLKNSGEVIYYSKIGDYKVKDKFFEIGGKNKKYKQIKERIVDAYLVKDDILYGSKKEIPLFLFGFLY